MSRYSPELPRGYKFTDPYSITADEAVALFKSAEFTESSLPMQTALDEWDEAVQESIVITGLRSRDRQLVGLGTISGDKISAQLSHLAVHPNHRSQGLGQALIVERVNLADKIGIEILEAIIMSTNTLRDVYYRLGFAAISEDVIVRYHQSEHSLGV